MGDRMFRQLRPLVPILGMVALSGCAPSRPAGADTEERLVHAGQTTFESLCASCHGVDARGNGPVASMLVVQPSDLTSLSASHDGRFPTAELRDIVNVHRVIPAHGTEDLPVWGDVWAKNGDRPRRQDIIDYEIDALIAYVRSIQRPRD